MSDDQTPSLPGVSPEVNALLRHGLTMVGGMLVSGGYLTGEQAGTVAGAVMVVCSVGLSLWQKHVAKQRLAAAIVAMPPRPPIDPHNPEEARNRGNMVYAPGRPMTPDIARDVDR